MKKTKATITGFLVAPLVSASIGITRTDTFGDLDIITFLGLLPMFYIFSSLAAIVFGVPIFLLLDRLRLVSWWSTIGFGMLIGAIAAVIFVIPNPVQFNALITMVAMGGASAFVFWLIWRLGESTRKT